MIVRTPISAAATKLQGKIATGDFDVFLYHNGKAKLQVKEIGEKLKEQGILPWLDEWELPPGLSWQQGLEKQIKRIKS
ncbi:MAG TPA: toll/interleukin-1 receptor domain-containing protein, partial [Ktedonobacteraceae bacterium]|nr:toll/interleukin-1 receptor domain-containing protein [Ktedonobacteraceae bacterium]